MNKKNFLLFAVLFVLGGIYLVYFRDGHPAIRISARPRPAYTNSRRGGTENKEAPKVTVSFTFDQKCELTELKVVPLADWETNKYAHAAWHLFADEKTAPMNGLIYGEKVKGMKPKIPRGQAEPLLPGVTYRVFITAGKATGQTDFTMPAPRNSLASR